MKKNKSMRIASALLVAGLLSTCVISGTFAKYTTTGSGSDTARVAKWGVTITANGTTFANEYAKDDDTVTGTITNSVVGTSPAKVVAPGTSGTMANAQISGTPEVAVAISYKADLALANWTIGDNSEYYCPISITINTTTYNGKDYDNAAAFETAVENAIAAVSQNITAGTDLSNSSNVTPLSVSWSWAFEGTPMYTAVTGESAPSFEANGYYSKNEGNYTLLSTAPDDWSSNWTNYYTQVEPTQTNEKDTALGNKMATALGTQNTTDNITISLTVTTTVSQID